MVVLGIESRLSQNVAEWMTAVLYLRMKKVRTDHMTIEKPFEVVFRANEFAVAVQQSQAVVALAGKM